MSITPEELRQMAARLAEAPDALASLAGSGEVAQFERCYARAVDCKFGLSCASGTAAIQLALMACGVGPGDEVVVAAYGWPQTVTAVLACGATPVYADVSPRSGTLSAAAAAAVVTERTRALLVTHLFGNPADMRGLRALATRYRLALVADACHAFGATYAGPPVARLADASAFSLGRGKLVSAGEGGIVVTGQRELYERMLVASQHPLRARAELSNPALSADLGAWSFTSRITRLTAAVGLVQIESAPERLKRRQVVRAALCERVRRIMGVEWLDAEPGGVSSAHEFVAVADDAAARAALLVTLPGDYLDASAGPVRTALHLRTDTARYWWPRALDPARAVGFGERGRCPVAESLCEREMCIEAAW
jgi:dTDP-4-amino-4,6-dideoxygalactose transaminase